MKHALIVGGTGMLSAVSLYLVEAGYHVSIIARNSARMERLIEKTENKNRMTPILVNYTNKKELREKVLKTIHQNGKIELVVAWIHSTGEGALSLIAEEISKHDSGWSLYHVLGSSSNLEEIKRKVSVPDTCIYHQVQLGFILEKNRSRWLTNEEISNGVIEAIHTGKQVFTVGVFEPWERRP